MGLGAGIYYNSHFTDEYTEAQETRMSYIQYGQSWDGSLDCLTLKSMFPATTRLYCFLSFGHRRKKNGARETRSPSPTPLP